MSAMTTAKRTAILIVAMHRSGTSALSRTLNLLGCDMPPKLIGADEWNSSGYWESKPIKDLNEEMLQSGGSDWSEWQEFNPNWFRSSAMRGFRDRAIELIGSEFGGSSLFVFKDPRLSILLPFWRAIFAELEIEPVVIHTLRHPIEVARSLERRNKFLIPRGILLWLRYTLEGERGSRGLRRFFTSYDELLDDCPGFIQRSQDALGLFWPRNSDRARREIGNFLSEGMRHHKESAKTSRILPYAGQWTEATFNVMKEWAAEGESIAGRKKLDDVYAEFTAGGYAFGAIARDNDERFAHIGQLSKDREENRAKLVEAERAAQAARAQGEVLEQAKAELEAKAATLTSQFDTLRGAKAQLEQRHLATQKQRDGLLEEKATLESAVAEARGQGEAIQKAKAALEERHLATQKQRDGLLEEKAALEAQASAAEEKAAAIQRAKTALEERHLATQQQRDGLLKDKAALEEQQAQTVQERDTLRAAQAVLEAQASAAEEKAAAIQRAKTALEERHLATQQERDALRERSAVLEAEKAAAQRECDLLGRQAQAMESAMTDSRDQRDALDAAKAALEADLAQAADKARALEQTQAALEAQHQAMSEERDALRQALAEREQTVSDYQVKATQTEALVRQWEDESRRQGEELAAQRSASAAELDALRHSLSQTESALRQRQLETEQAAEGLRTAQAAVQAERDARDALKADLERELAAARGKGVEHERSWASAEKSLKLRFDEIAIITRQLAANEAETAAATAALVQAQQLADAREEELGRLQAALAGQQGQLAEEQARAAALQQSLDDQQRRAAEAEARHQQAGIERDVQHRRALEESRADGARLAQETAAITILLQQQEALFGESLRERDARLAEQDDKLRQKEVQLAEQEENLRQKDGRLAEGAARLAQLDVALAQTTKEHDTARAMMDQVMEDVRRQKEMLRATVIANRAELDAKQNEVEARQGDVKGAQALGSQAYRQFLTTLAAMLSQAVLPFPALTRARTIERQRRILDEYGAFDPDWYLAAHTDLPRADTDPYLHYIRHGLSEGRAPNAAMEQLRSGALPGGRN